MILRVFVILVCALLAGRSKAQTLFQNIRWQDGLSAKQVRCLYKDGSGLLWIGTANGLDRYDGAVVKKYPGPDARKAYYVNAIQPFGKDTLLIGLREGILLFDQKSGTFQRDRRFAALAKKYIVSIRADHKGRTWIATNSTIFVFDKNKLYRAAGYLPPTHAFDVPNQITAMVWDTTRTGIWVAAENPFFIDCANDKAYCKGENAIKSPVLENKYVYALAVEKNGSIWFGSYKTPALNHWDILTGKVTTYHTLDDKPMEEGCNFLFIDHQQRLWISTWLFAAFLKEPGKPIKKLEYSQDQAYTIGYGHFRDAISDDQGNVWLGTINGVSKTSPRNPIEAIYKLPSFPFFLHTGFAHANAILVDSQTVWACKEDGIVEYKTSDRTYRRYTVPGSNMRDSRFEMAAVNDGIYWFAGHSGLYYLAPGDTRLKRFEKIQNPRQKQSADFVFIDPQGNIWFQIVGDAVYRYDPVTKTSTRFDGTKPATGLFEYTHFQGFLPLKNGDVLFTAEGLGLFRFDSGLGKMIPPSSEALEDEYFYSLAQDKKGNIWAASGGKGLMRITTDGRILETINTTTGLPSDIISAIQVDEAGKVWGATREGLFMFDPAAKAVSRVEMDLGKTLQDYWNYVAIDRGKVYAVMLDHIVVINPEHFAAVPVRKPPLITSVKVSGQEKLNLARNGQLTLKPDESFVTFQFASLSHRDIPSLQYRYRMEGVDESWVNAGRTITASYTKLPSGRYTFLVNSTDENDHWMTTSSRLQILVLPYWWETWWFISLCAVMTGFALAWAYQARVRRRRKKVLDDTIEYFANSVYGENSVNEICWDIARNCIAKLQFEDCVVYLIDEQRDMLVQKAAYGPKSPKDYEILNPIEIPLGKGIVGSVAVTGQVLLIGDTGKDPRYIVDDQERRSELAVPIVHEGKIIGVIDSEHSHKHFYTDEHVRVISTIAAISANKIAEAMARAQAQDQEIMLLQINKMLAESQLMALRAQMNPHFVFNCLNSIQECIVTKKYLEASKYLNKFSRLFRMVLNNSGKDLVALTEEREVLELYLELELMRFGHSFSYEIDIGYPLEEENVYLPSMLLQPYVENALWHGLMHKDGDRHLRIAFKSMTDHVFVCEIEDNGIGRAKAMEMKAESSTTKSHESRGMKICQDRLDLLAKQGRHANLRIEDKYDEAGAPAGTLIVIELSSELLST